MNGRPKTDLEMNETEFQQNQRLRFALLVISRVDNLEEAKRIALCAMRGEKHGYEIKEKSIETFTGNLRAGGDGSFTAAAEVVGTVEVGNVADSYKMAMRREIAATIERCAQVAEALAPEPDGAPDGIWTATDSKLLHLANDIAAEIRALKDKP